MKTIAVVASKGGVGKTAIAVSVAAAVAEAGGRAVLVDLDPAAAASRWLDRRSDSDGAQLLAVLRGRGELRPLETSVPGLSIVPGGSELAAHVLRTGDREQRLQLRAALARLPGAPAVAVLDTPPGLASLAVVALAAAQLAAVPAEVSALGLESLADALALVEQVRAALNPELRTRIVLSKVDARLRLARDVSARLRSEHGRTVCRAELRQCARLAEAPAWREPVTVYAPTSRSAEDSRALARELTGKGTP